MINFEGGVNKIQHIQQSMIKIAEDQTKDEVWSNVISRVEKGQLPEKAETQGKAREVLVARSTFNPAVFKMKDGMLMFTKAANRNQTGEVRWICIPASMVKDSSCFQQGQNCGSLMEDVIPV